MVYYRQFNNTYIDLYHEETVIPGNILDIFLATNILFITDILLMMLRNLDEIQEISMNEIKLEIST